MALTNPLRTSLFSLAVAVAGVGLAGPALAHAHLVSEIPGQNTSGPAPQELRLKFSEALELKFTTVKLTGPDKAVVKTGALALDPADATLLIVPLSGALPPGRYGVAWRATAADTHKTQGTYSFSVQP